MSIVHERPAITLKNGLKLSDYSQEPVALNNHQKLYMEDKNRTKSKWDPVLCVVFRLSFIKFVKPNLIYTQ